MSDPQSIRVTFFPVAEQYGYIAEAIQTRNRITQSKWLTFLTYYCMLHIILVPVILALFGQYLLAAASVIATGAFSIAYNKFGKTSAYVDFYRQSFENNPEQIEVELLEDGVRTSCDDCYSLYRWDNIVELSNKDEAVYFLMKECGIAVPKTAFSSPDEISAFLTFVDSKIERR